jgi:ribonucleoside-triphosphate reductase
MITQIRKRDGSIVQFKQEKITDAVYKAGVAVAEKEGKIPDRTVSQRVSDRVLGKLEAIFNNGVIPDVEYVQNVVERTLMEMSYEDTAKAYILYRDQHKRARGLLFDGAKVIKEYVGDTSWRIRENSNMTFSLQGMNVALVEEIVGNHWLTEVYPKGIAEAHKNGEFHIHNLGTYGPYCVGWDLEDLLREGFKGVRGKITAKPAKHLDVALMQAVNFLYTLQGEAAGAQAFSNFDTYMAPFIRGDDLSYEEVKQRMQGFLHNMNVSTRVGFQTPFTNVTMDLRVPKDMESRAVIMGGKIQESIYGEYQKEMDMFNRAFAECMMEGDADSRVFTFPIPTYNVTKDFPWDDPRLDPVWEMTAKFGIPYFANFVNSDMNPEDARSMCCRLRLDKTQIIKRGGIFGSNPLTGSIGVVTLNMPRIGYTSKTKEGFFEELSRLMELARDSLEIKRDVLEKNMKLYPYSRFYLRDVNERFGKYWHNHFSTIGLLGMNEAIENFMPGYNIATPEGRGFALEVLDFMRGKTGEFQEKTGNLYNLEATPGEGTTRTFAMKDKRQFPGIIVANEQEVRARKAAPFYTNSTHLPVNHTDDLFEALELQDELQTKYTGGTVLHGFLGERPTAEQAKGLVKVIAQNFHLPYFTLTPTFSICPSHGYISGEHAKCPTCGESSEVWSRSVGYLRPVEQWNDGKQEEFATRKTYKVAQ